MNSKNEEQKLQSNKYRQFKKRNVSKLILNQFFYVPDLVDPHDPVLGGVGLLQNVQLEVLVPNLGVPHPVVARWLACVISKGATTQASSFVKYEKFKNNYLNFEAGKNEHDNLVKNM